MSHRNIPVFIPHMGCPHQCVFCNQRSISGCRAFCREDVPRRIDAALSTLSREDEAEIAFFGGSFTGIDRELMLWLLDRAEQYVREGRVKSIRLSTRPDYISHEILELLSRYSVRTIELGLQSMDDEVLKQCERGHSAKCARNACQMITAAGFSLVGQMMIGLPGATPESELLTAREIIAMGATAARIYPTVVFYGTPLEGMMRKGLYQPLSLEAAVHRSANVLTLFAEAGVACIRIGLCATEELISPEHVAAGPNHPALGELVFNAYYYDAVLQRLTQAGLLGREVVLYVPAAKVSQIAGQHRANIDRFLRETDTRIRKIVGEHNRSDILPVLWQRGRTGQRRNDRPCI